MRNSRRARREHETAELNITAFMNLMVILVPFLLITAVFSRLAILELNLPASSSEPAEEPEQNVQLEITIRESSIEVGDRRGVLLGKYPNNDTGYDFEKLTEKLNAIKEVNPDKLDATLLLEPDIPYDVLVQAMDKIRISEVIEDGELIKAELFPLISIGDAVALPAASAQAPAEGGAS